MKIGESAQERLEQLWMVSEENGVNDEVPFTNVNNADDELQQMGLVERWGGEVVLTAEGKTQAALAIRRHRLAERLLADVLTTEESILDDRACGLEHALFDGVDEAICTLLGHPTICPHGKAIPPGECCKQMRASVPRLIASLAELKPGVTGKIAYIQLKDAQRLQKLMAMGVLPGVNVRVVRDYPAVVFEAGYSQFAVDEDIAADIFVRIDQ
jgi:DtxR family Mn-dependent transcriptional regulator